MSNCSFYKYRVKNKDKFTQKIDNTGKYSPKHFHYIVHHEGQILELQKVLINKETQLITGFLGEFDGLPKKYYDKIQPHGLKTKKGKAEDFYAVQQVHIYLKGKLKANASGALEIPFNEIQRIELSKNAGAASFFTTFGITVVSIAAGLATFLIIACNCPHVYIHNGSEEVFNTTLFTGAKSVQLERHDYKVIPDYFKDSSNVRLRIVNDERENQFTNQLELLTIYHKENTEVFPDKNGNLHSITKPVAPSKALDNSLNSIQEKLAFVDNQAYPFNADSMDGLSSIYLTFKKIPNTREAKLVLRVKNTQWSGLVFKEFISQFGRSYQNWLKLDRKRSGRKKTKWMNEQGINLLVDIKTVNGWKTLDYLNLVGEVNYNTMVLPMALSEKEECIELRIRSGFMFWEIDYVAMDFSADSNLKVQRLKPTIAKGNTGISYLSQLSEDDDDYMLHSAEVTSTQIEFDGINLEPRLTRTLILHSKGYYTDNAQFTGKPNWMAIRKYASPGGLSTLSKKLHSTLTEGLALTE